MNTGIRAKAQGPSGLKLETSELKPRDLVGIVGGSSWGPLEVLGWLLRTFGRALAGLLGAWEPRGAFAGLLGNLLGAS